MERIKDNRKALIGLTVGFILVTLVLVVVVDDFVQNAILVPIAYYLWLGNIIVKALPESCFLWLLIILNLIIIAPSLRRGRRNIWRPKGESSTVDGEVTIWEQRLQLLVNGAYTENRFAYHLGHLVLQILAYEERLPIRAVIYNIEKGAFNMPDHVRSYVLNGIGMGKMQKGLSFIDRIKLRFRRLFQLQQKSLTLSQTEDIILTIQYVEAKLQIMSPAPSKQPEMQETLQAEVSHVE